MVELSFAYPYYLFFLLIIPLLILVHFLTLKGVKSKALAFANFEAISRIRGIDFFSRNIIILFLSISIVFIGTLALSGLTATVLANTNQYSIVLAIDSSQSMEAVDFSPNRLEAAKDISANFVKSAPFKSKFGVVSFSGSTIVISPVSEDLTAVANSIDRIKLSLIGGTDLFEAVATSTNLLKGEESKAVILFSDGQINVGTIAEAVHYANEHDVIVHTVAIGTSEGGRTSYGISTLDEDSLKALAYNTNGEYFSASNSEELREILENIFEVTNKKVKIDLTSYLLMAIIVLFTFEYILLNTRYKSFP